MRRSDIPAFEAEVGAEGRGNYHVFARPDDNGSTTPTPRDEVMALRHIEPMARNLGALGVNVLSIPAARAAIDSAIRTDRPAATPAFKLTQELAGDEQTGVVVYQAVYTGNPGNVQQRLAAAQGVVFVTLRIEDTLRTVLDQVPHYLTV